ncbi:MAG: hypothetical protein P1P85_03075 [Patescibacteria group bacterium]|nr:hypothetical protein [Patescibacteria group bacterium]
MNIKKISISVGFLIFCFIVLLSTKYLIQIVPAPQLSPFDLFSLLHAFTATGFSFFVLISINDNKMRNNAFLVLIILVFTWEIFENILLKNTVIAGDESILNSLTDIIIGFISIGMLWAYNKPEQQNKKIKIQNF